MMPKIAARESHVPSVGAGIVFVSHHTMVPLMRHVA